MDKRRAIIAGTMLVGACVAGFLMFRKPAAPPTSTPEGVDYRMTPLGAAYEAPEGKTPCETAYNAFHAIEDAAKIRGGAGLPFGPMPDQGTFLARCAKLTEQEQQCLMPRYQAKHHDVCDPIAQRFAKKHPLFND